MQNLSLNVSAFISGGYRQQTGYKSFMPEVIHRQWNIDIPELVQLLSDADRKLGELNAFGDSSQIVKFLYEPCNIPSSSKQSFYILHG